jgi:hypothetical protein
MELTRGSIYIHRLFSVRELGFGSPEPHLDRVIRAFLKLGEAVAAQWIQLPKGVLLLQAVPGDPASGAIYFYDRRGQVFYIFTFDGADDRLTIEEFRALVHEYGLLKYAEDPALLQAEFRAASAA